MKLVICEDEKPIRDYIGRCAAEVDTDLKIEKYPDASAVLGPGFDADILFLDIQMPGIDGMKAARILRIAGHKCVIVFVTAIEERVFEAFDVGAAQYIVKPFEKEKLIRTIRKAIELAKENRAVSTLLCDDQADETTDSINRRTITIKSGGVSKIGRAHV